MQDEAPDPRNAKAWDEHVHQRLTEEQISFLAEQFLASEVADVAYAVAGPKDRVPKAAERRIDLLWRAWCLDVLEIDVGPQPGGRAILRAPGEPYRVEIQWHYDEAARWPGITSVEQIAEPGEVLFTGPRLGMHELTNEQRADLERRSWLYQPIRDKFYRDKYLAAFNLRMSPQFTDAGKRFLSRLPRRRPQVAHSADPDFYARILAAYEELVARGRRDPANELARRMKANPSTVRSWIRRGRILRNQAVELELEPELRASASLTGEGMVTKRKKGSRGGPHGKKS